MRILYSLIRHNSQPTYFVDNKQGLEEGKTAAEQKIRPVYRFTKTNITHTHALALKKKYKWGRGVR